MQHSFFQLLFNFTEAGILTTLWSILRVLSAFAIQWLARLRHYSASASWAALTTTTAYFSRAQFFNVSTFKSSYIRLLQRKPDSEIVFRESTSGEVPVYAVLSYIWGEEEIIYQDLKKGCFATLWSLA